MTGSDEAEQSGLLPESRTASGSGYSGVSMRLAGLRVAARWRVDF